MKLFVASPSGGRPYEDLESVHVTTVDGQMGVLRGHADLIASVPGGPVRIRRGGREQLGVCGEGVLRVEGGDVHLAVEHWTTTAPERELLEERLTDLTDRLGASDLDPRAATRLRREIAFLERWLDHAGELSD